MTPLHTELSDIFGPEGWLTRQGRDHLPSQLAYALSVADWLTGASDKPVALIEGETGTGKSLGYLFPLALHWERTGRKTIIATHTISLQTQLLKGDIALVTSYFEDQERIAPRVRQRLGMQHFVDPSRVARLADLMPTPETRLLLEWATDAADAESGLIEDWLSRYGELPDGVERDDICLTPGSPKGVNLAYEHHKDQDTPADMILTSHMMVLLEARSGYAIFDLKANNHQILFDEADQIPAQTEKLGSKRVQIKEIIRELQSVMGQGSSSLDRHLTASIRTLTGIDQTLQALGQDNRINESVIEAGRDRHGVKEHLVNVQGECARIQRTLKRSALGRKTHDHGRLHDIDQLLSWVTQFSESDDLNLNAIAWSPVHKVPSLMHQAARPGFIVSRLWKQFGQRVCLTSATLGPVPGQATAPDALFVPLKSTLGISRAVTGVQVSYAPASFGRLEIVLSDPGLPHPVVRGKKEEKEEGVESTLNQRWLDHACAMAQKASETGPTLVLTVSYAETRQIGKRLSDAGVLIHQKGQALADLIREFRIGNYRLLVSPTAWQGTSIRAEDGSQLVRNLVITRIPYSPPDRSKERLQTLLDQKSGIHAQVSRRYHYHSVQNRTLILMRQGIGRLIRNKHDSGTLWIADPRFPHDQRQPNSNQHNVLGSAIPVRFYDAYRQAKQFVSGKLVQTQKPLPKEIEEFINL